MSKLVINCHSIQKNGKELRDSAIIDVSDEVTMSLMASSFMHQLMINPDDARVYISFERPEYLPPEDVE